MADREVPPPRVECGHPTPDGPCCRLKGHATPRHWARLFTARDTLPADEPADEPATEPSEKDDYCGARGDPRDANTPVCILPPGHEGPHKRLVMVYEVIPDPDATPATPPAAEPAEDDEEEAEDDGPRKPVPHAGLVSGGKMFCWHCGKHQQIFPEEGLIISAKSMKAMQLLGEDFEDRHRDCLETKDSPTKTKYTDPTAWRRGPDTGISSLTIYIVMMGLPNSELGRWRPDVPLDGADFGRCYRLLEQFPHWRPRLAEVTERFPAWTGLVGAWDELCALYRIALEAHGKCRFGGKTAQDKRDKDAARAADKVLYDRIKQLTSNPQKAP